MSLETLTLEENILLSLLGIVIASLFLLCTLYRSSIPAKRENTSKRKQKANVAHEKGDETYTQWSWDVTGYLRFPKRFVFAVSASDTHIAPRRLIPCLFYRIWQKYRHGRVVPASSPKHASDMASESFPLTRLVATTDLVVAYSKEFVNEFSCSRRPKRKRKRYALILKSATPEAKAEIERYFGSVVEDILSVRQVSPFVYINSSKLSRQITFRLRSLAFLLRAIAIILKLQLVFQNITHIYSFSTLILVFLYLFLF